MTHSINNNTRDYATEHEHHANVMRLQGIATLAEFKLNGLPLLLAELRAHGEMERACAACGTRESTIWLWRRKDPAMDAQIKLALRFAKSAAVNYGEWVTR